MAFDFVIETPEHRRVNRNNHKLIQKRATQAGAKTRSDQKNRRTQQNAVSQEDDKHAMASGSALGLLNQGCLTLTGNYIFQERFGPNCYTVYLPDVDTAQNNANRLIFDPTTSILQRRLLDALATTSRPVDANQFFKIGTLTSNQFLSFVPSLYSKNQLLDAAIECLFARMNLAVPLFGPSSTTCMPSTADTPYRLYGKALQHLRNELENPQQQALVYLWYATKLLTLYELITMGDGPAWVWHAAGAARILYRIGPDNIYTEFELSLLASQLHIQVAETIFTGKPCYLADPKWQCALTRTILPIELYTYRSRCSISLWSIGARLPNVFHAFAAHLETEDHIYSTHPPSCTLIRSIVVDLEKWRCKWHDEVDDTCRMHQNSALIRHQALNVLLAYYMLAIIAHRLLIAHQLHGMQTVEANVTDACSRMITLKELMSVKVQQEQERSIYYQVAHGTYTTIPKWEARIGASNPNEGVDAQTFFEWCNLIGCKSDLDLTPAG